MERKLDDIFELAPLQQGVLFHCLYAPDSTVYNVQMGFDLDGSLDLEKFTGAWQQLMQRHAALRTTFEWQDLEHPYQVVHSEAELTIDTVDLRELSGEEQNVRLETLQKQVQATPIDLTHAPLMRLNLARLADNRYRFLWIFHHIILEGWSASIILGDMRALYNAACRGEELSLPAVRPFHDYINWVQEHDLSQAKEYWCRVFQDQVEPCHLPIDLALDHAPAQVELCAEQQVNFDLALTRALSDLARKARVTVNTVFQGCWSILLSRYSGHDDVVFGVVVSGRPPQLAGSEAMVGMFVNTIPARITVPTDQHLAPWLQNFQRLLAEAKEHEYCSLSQVQTWIGSSPATPLYDTNMAFENWLGEIPEGNWLEGISTGGFEVSSGSDNPLTIIIIPGANCRVILRYDTQRFTEQSIGRMAGHMKTLLEAMVSSPDCLLSKLPLLTIQEQQQLIYDWNQTQTGYPRDNSIHELFEQQATQRPDAVALVFGEDTISYGELNARANQLAHYLQNHGVGPEVLVGLFMERGLELVISILGILKAGGAYVPLDPEYPYHRLAFMLEDSKSTVLLTQSVLRERLPSYPGQVISIDTDWDKINQEQGTNLHVDTSAQNLAYVIYTSGSTGRPKGTCVEQRSVVRLVKDTNYLEFGTQEIVLQFAPVSFDASTLELWGSLLNGAKLVIFRPGPASLQEIGEAITHYGISTLWLTAALFNQMVDEQLENLLQVRQLLAGGEALSPSHVKRVLARLKPGQRLVNGYGPTENTTFTCCHVMNSESEIDRNVPIGRPISNTQVYVLDAVGMPVPAGIPGELYIAGDGLARGYLNRPELTAEKFVSVSVADMPDTRMYRTGDQVRFLNDGTLEFMGRFDQQVKLRGFRIELGEVEVVIGGHDAVRNAVVMMREDDPGDKRLVAYLVLDDKQGSSLGQVKEYTKERLPEYMVPSAFVVLDSLPLTPNDKVDRDALQPPAKERSIETDYVPPRTPAEQQMAGIWHEILGVENPGIDDNFFDLGGNSLLLMRTHAKMCEISGRDVPVTKLFQYPTMRGLAKQLAAVEQGRKETGMDKVRERAQKQRDAMRRKKSANEGR